MHHESKTACHNTLGSWYSVIDSINLICARYKSTVSENPGELNFRNSIGTIFRFPLPFQKVCNCYYKDEFVATKATNQLCAWL